jgi:hypothetical protein
MRGRIRMIYVVIMFPIPTKKPCDIVNMELIARIFSMVGIERRTIPIISKG